MERGPYAVNNLLTTLTWHREGRKRTEKQRRIKRIVQREIEIKTKNETEREGKMIRYVFKSL